MEPNTFKDKDGNFCGQGDQVCLGPRFGFVQAIDQHNNVFVHFDDGNHTVVKGEELQLAARCMAQ